MPEGAAKSKCSEEPVCFVSMRVFADHIGQVKGGVKSVYSRCREHDWCGTRNGWKVPNLGRTEGKKREGHGLQIDHILDVA